MIGNHSGKKLFLVLLAMLTQVLNGHGQELLTRKFEWRYADQPFELEMTIDKKVYNHFASLPRVIDDYSYYAASCDFIPFVPNLVNGLIKLATEADLNRWQMMEMTIAFVQSLPYTHDKGYDHPKFPAETLVDGTGDCEDTSILLAAILEELGIEAVLLSPPKHMGIGIACSDCHGRAYKSKGTNYFYVETTAKGWEIGAMPEDLMDKEVKLIHVDRDYTIEKRLAKNPLSIDPKLTRKGESGNYRDHSVEVKNGSAKITVQDTKFLEDGVIEVYRKRYVRSVE
ncbi:MAG: hypothetical protein ACI9FU_000184 [Granulosicoccus sp.]|jgi:hypothetical protein